MTHCLLHSSQWPCKLCVAAPFHKAENWGSDSCMLPITTQVITASGAEVGSSCSLTPEFLFFPMHFPVSSTPYMPHIFHFWFKWGAIISLKEIQPWTMGATHRHLAALWESLWCCLSQAVRAAWHIVCPAISSECCSTRSGEVGLAQCLRAIVWALAFPICPAIQATLGPSWPGHILPSVTWSPLTSGPVGGDHGVLYTDRSPCSGSVRVIICYVLEGQNQLSPVLIVQNNRVLRISSPGYPTQIIR